MPFVCVITLLRLQRAWTTTHYPQGVATLYPWAMCFCAYSATITDMNFRIRIFNFCTSNCTP